MDKKSSADPAVVDPNPTYKKRQVPDPAVKKKTFTNKKLGLESGSDRQGKIGPNRQEKPDPDPTDKKKSDLDPACDRTPESPSATLVKNSAF